VVAAFHRLSRANVHIREVDWAGGTDSSTPTPADMILTSTIVGDVVYRHGVMSARFRQTGSQSDTTTFPPGMGGRQKFTSTTRVLSILVGHRVAQQVGGKAWTCATAKPQKKTVASKLSLADVEQAPQRHYSHPHPTLYYGRPAWTVRLTGRIFPHEHPSRRYPLVWTFILDRPGGTLLQSTEQWSAPAEPSIATGIRTIEFSHYGETPSIQPPKRCA
jgi:hypothetical protein